MSTTIQIGVCTSQPSRVVSSAAPSHQDSFEQTWIADGFRRTLIQAGLGDVDKIIATAAGQCLRVLPDRENWYLSPQDIGHSRGMYLKKHRVRNQSAGRVEAENTLALEALDIPVMPLLVWHLKMPVLGFRFGKFTYITDANRIDEPEKEKIRGSEVMVLNALRQHKHISHYTLDEAVAMVNELGIPKAYFTHISHQLGLHTEINTMLPEGMVLAWDGQQLFFD